MADSSAAASGTSAMDKFMGYVRTQKGLILAAEIVLSLVILICYAASYSGGYTAVAICEMVFAAIFFVVYMMELDKQFRVVHWTWSDLFRAAIGAALYLITSLITVITKGADGARITGGAFGLIAGVLFAYDTYITYLQLKSTREHTPAATDDRV